MRTTARPKKASVQPLSARRIAVHAVALPTAHNPSTSALRTSRMFSKSLPTEPSPGLLPYFRQYTFFAQQEAYKGAAVRISNHGALSPRYFASSSWACFARSASQPYGHDKRSRANPLHPRLPGTARCRRRLAHARHVRLTRSAPRSPRSHPQSGRTCRRSSGRSRPPGNRRR